MNGILKGAAAASLFPCVLASLFSPARAQSNELKEEISYVRELVSGLRFIELAEYETKALHKKYQQSDDFKLVAQLAIEVSLQGAKVHPDRNERPALFKRALDQSEQFIDRYQGEPVAIDARVTLTEAVIEFGYFLNQELEIAMEAAPEKVPELEEEAAATFRKGVQACDQLMSALEVKKDKEINYYVSWLRKGILLREHARAVKKDRQYLSGQARDVLEKLILDRGEETVIGQRALLEMAMIDEVVGDLDRAAGSYKDTIAAIWESLNDKQLELAEAVQRLMFSMMQEAYDHLATALFKQGKAPEVKVLVKEFWERIKAFETEPDPRFGDSVLLTEASVLASSTSQEEVSNALKMAKEINEKHPNDYVGLKAKNLIRDILARSSDLVTGDLLLEVAKGDYQAKDYDQAIIGLKRALNRMDAETKKKLGLETWNLIGRSNAALKRDLEATLAFARGLEDHGKGAAGNETNKICDGMRRGLGQVVKLSGDAETFKPLKSRVDALLEAFDTGGREARYYVEGQKLQQMGDYEKAAAAFAKVPKGFVKYEVAIGQRIECLRYLRQYDQARKAIADYRSWLKDPGAEIKGDERERRGYRLYAIAGVDYSEGRLLYDEARGEATGKPDLTKYPAVVRHFLEFEQKHGDTLAAQMPKVHEVLGHAYIELGEMQKAEDRYAKLKTMGNDAHKLMGIYLFNALRGQEAALRVEHQSLVKTKPAEAKATYDKMEKVMHRALDMGLDYAKTIGEPSYGVLHSCMSLGEELEAWPETEWLASKILKLYSNDKELAEKDSFRKVKPTLGLALLHQPNRLQEAYDMLLEARKALAEDKKSTYYEVQRYICLALGGWADLDKTGLNYLPNPGIGKPDEAYEIYWGKDSYRGYGLHSSRAPRFSLPWYRYHLELYYFCRQAIPIDSKFKEISKTVYNIARSVDDFATLRNMGKAGERIYNLFRLIPQ